eukprot:TRINITY_DN1464_c0_g1_i3.p1 TRINITY_DN1464_c0_g1~~TRINITY_DN1464_c0_g1_i3.p1  ORF type:complete len:209 (+),score=24.47 TRINITY_DN1464_c0_g1_i3:163-789(+)
MLIAPAFGPQYLTHWVREEATNLGRMVGGVSATMAVGESVTQYCPKSFIASYPSRFCTCSHERKWRTVPAFSNSSYASGSCKEWRFSTRRFSKSARRRVYPLVMNEIAGQYEESFSDVGKHLLNYFTVRAVRTVLGQLYEMNPTQYTWLYEFCVNNKPNDGKRFLKVLVKERQELGERVMITRLHLFKTWAKVDYCASSILFFWYYSS